MADHLLPTRRHAAPWRVLLPFTLAVMLLHGWLLGGLATVGAERLAAVQGDAAPVLARPLPMPPGGTSGRHVLAVTTRRAPEVSAGAGLLAAPQPMPEQAVKAPPLTRVSTVAAPGAAAHGSVADNRRHPGAPAAPVGSLDLHPSATDTTTGLQASNPVDVAGAAGATHAAGADGHAAAGLDTAGSPTARLAQLALAAPRPGARSGGSAAPPPGPVAAAAPVPSPTSPPPSAELIYGVRRGPLAGEGKLVWRMAAGSYTLSLEARLPVIGTIFSENSSGAFDAHGLAPQRYTERRMRRSERALTMTRDGPGSGTLSFSASTTRLALLPGTQDRVSWLVQLAALFAAAAPGGAAPGSASAVSAGVMTSGATLPVASVNGDLSQWQFKLGAPEGGLLHLERRSANPYDTVAEVWLDPARRYWPVRVRLSEAGSDALELVLRQWRE
jgi:hypothetical protein